MLILIQLVLPIFLVSLIFFLFNSKSNEQTTSYFPKSYPFFGHYFALIANWDRLNPWITQLIQNSPSATIVLYRPFGARAVDTGNPANVQHILKSHFHLYQKGNYSRTTLSDFLGDGIFNSDGDTWKFQRQLASHEFNTKSLRKFVETVVDTELSERLIPILSSAAENGTVLDLQDILQRFAFDNICQIAFGYDPAYLLPTLPRTEFAEAFEECVIISSQRFQSFWKIKRLFNIGSEKKLRQAISQVRDFALKLVKEKKEELKNNSSTHQSVDLLSRFLNSGHSDETFVTDIVISFILAGRDTTSAALTWYFWLLSKHTLIETEVVKEINEKSESETRVFEEVKDMIYTRLYPPVPSDRKFAESDDVLPDGTEVKKGTSVTYHPYAMGRLEMLWGEDWADYKPERWLERDFVNEKWNFVGRDAYTYPVFQAGPRVCLGKEMAFLQMKRVVAGVLSRFEVRQADPKVEPEFVSYLTAKMKGGFQ